ncbi:MAG TPA: IS3 family transposase [Povalibacter sp.]
MSKRSGRNHLPAFKAKVAVEAVKGQQTVIEIAERFNVHPTQVTQWKTQLLERAMEAFGASAEKTAQPAIKELHAKIGQQALEIDFLGRRARSHRRSERKAMIDREHELPLVRQAVLVGLSRGAIYYEPRPLPERDLQLMRRIDELHLEHPFAGSRMLRDLLNAEAQAVGRRHVSTLIKRMGIEAIYRKKNTSRPNLEHTIYPYLLRRLQIDRPNQVWATDITYIPMARGFVYLAAVIDWYTRKVLSWRLSNTLTTDFCVEALEEALATYGTPEIFNTDQGCQFTSLEFTSVLKQHGIRISMDGKGRWRDNVFVERLWKSVKYEEVYLRAYDSVSAARSGLARYFQFYNTRRPHTALDRRTPDAVYFESLPLAQAA